MVTSRSLALIAAGTVPARSCRRRRAHGLRVSGAHAELPEPLERLSGGMPPRLPLAHAMAISRQERDKIAAQVEQMVLHLWATSASGSERTFG
jgi:hypothetical protein